MSIMGNLKKVSAAVEADNDNGGNFGVRLRKSAINALIGGIRSADWMTYMSIFADNAEQLRRLTVVDEQNDPNWVKESRAYIVSNAVCGANTTTVTTANVRDEIDEGLTDEPDGLVVKPFSIP